MITGISQMQHNCAAFGVWHVDMLNYFWQCGDCLHTNCLNLVNLIKFELKHLGISWILNSNYWCIIYICSHFGICTIWLRYTAVQVLMPSYILRHFRVLHYFTWHAIYKNISQMQYGTTFRRPSGIKYEPICVNSLNLYSYILSK